MEENKDNFSYLFDELIIVGGGADFNSDEDFEFEKTNPIIGTTIIQLKLLHR